MVRPSRLVFNMFHAVAAGRRSGSESSNGWARPCLGGRPFASLDRCYEWIIQLFDGCYEWIIQLFDGCYKWIIQLFDGCYKWIIQLFDGCYKWIIQLFDGCYQWIIRLFDGCYKWIIQLLDGCYQWIIQLFDGCYKWIIRWFDWFRRAVAHFNPGRHCYTSSRRIIIKTKNVFRDGLYLGSPPARIGTAVRLCLGAGLGVGCPVGA